jgi:hypothetical protein
MLGAKMMKEYKTVGFDNQTTDGNNEFSISIPNQV